MTVQVSYREGTHIRISPKNSVLSFITAKKKYSQIEIICLPDFYKKKQTDQVSYIVGAFCLSESSQENIFFLKKSKVLMALPTH